MFGKYSINSLAQHQLRRAIAPIAPAPVYQCRGHRDGEVGRVTLDVLLLHPRVLVGFEPAELRVNTAGESES